MLLRVFRENQAFSLLLMLLLSALLVIFMGIGNSYEPSILSLYNHSAFYLFPWLRNIDSNTVLSTIINIFFVLFTGFYLTRLTIKHQLLPTRNLMPMFLFFFMCLPWYASYSGLSFQLITLPILLFVTDNLFRAAENKQHSMSFFNSAMLLSLASIFYFNIIFYLLFIFFLYFRLRGAYWREFVFIIIGAALPYFILFTTLYLLDIDSAEYVHSIRILWQYKLIFNSGNIFMINIIFSGVLFLIASWQAINQYVKMKIITRKFSISLFSLFVLSVAFVLLVPSINRDGIVYLAIPLAFLYGYYFTTCRINIINQVLFFLFLAGNAATIVYSFL